MTRPPTATIAPITNAARSVWNTATASPSAGAPRPWDRSKNSENVPTAWLRSDAGAAFTAAVKRAGKSSDIPTASMAVALFHTERAAFVAGAIVAVGGLVMTNTRLRAGTAPVAARSA